MEHSPESWDEPVYAISVAAEMVSLHPQTLRRYEELGLVLPARRSGRRLYSQRDIETVRTIARLGDELGLNLAGVEVLLHLRERVGELQAELERLSRIRLELEARVGTLEAELRKQR